MQRWFSSTGAVIRGTQVARGSWKFDWWPSSANWGFGGVAPDALVVGGMPYWRIQGGAIGNDLLVPSVTVRPAFRAWPTGLFVWEANVRWQSNEIDSDYGIILAPGALARPVGTVAHGFSLRNALGVLTMSVRGLLGVQNFDVSGNGTFNPQADNKVRLEYRLPTSVADGSMRLFVNDDTAPRWELLTNNPNWPGNTSGVLALTVGVNAPAGYFYFVNMDYFDGPDTAIGMPDVG